jgi:hypothetical protein
MPWRGGFQAAGVLVLPVALLVAVSGRVSADSGPYRAVALAGPGSVSRLESQLGDERFLCVLKLNRLDRLHALRADTLVVPDAGLPLSEVSPWPRAVAGVDSTPKLLLISLRIQAFAAYEAGRLAWWGPISSGGPSAPSRSGLFHSTWKSPLHVSSVDSAWVMPWTVNIDSEVGTALHQYALTGRPSSHCCIRLLEDDARWIYDWVSTWRVSPDGRSVLDLGTPVILFGEYDYGAPPPWKRLAVDPEATRLTLEEIASALSLLPGQGRGGVP